MASAFWVVWNEDGAAPMVKHPSLGSAKAEAERLSRNHGGAFHVLQSVGTARRVDIEWTDHAHDTGCRCRACEAEMPF